MSGYHHSWSNPGPFNNPHQYLEHVANLSAAPEGSNHGEDIENVPLVYSVHARNVEDDPWNPMKVNRSHLHPAYTSGVGGSSIPAHYPTDVVSEPDVLDSPSQLTLPPIGIGAFLSGMAVHRHSYNNNRSARPYRAASISESVRTEPASWVTTEDAISAFSERAETVRSVTSIGRGGVTTGSLWRCDDCDKSFTSRGGLSKHKKVGAHGIRSHKCPKCGASFDMSKDLNRHLGTKHKSGGNDLFCHVPTCNRSYGKGKGFSRYDNLRQHIKMRHGKDELRSMPKGGHRVVQAESINALSRSEDIASWPTQSQLDENMDTSVDGTGTFDYGQDEDAEEDDRESDDDMHDGENGGDGGIELDAEGDMTIPDENDDAPETRQSNSEKERETASYQSMPPPPIPKKSRSPEKSQKKRISWSPVPELIPPPRILWPQLEQSESDEIPTHESLEVTEDDSALSQRGQSATPSRDVVPVETSENAGADASVSTPQSIDVLGNAMATVDEAINKRAEANDVTGLEELLSCLESRAARIRALTDSARDYAHGVLVTTAPSDDRHTPTVGFLLHPSSPSISGHSRSSSMPITASYASSAIEVFSNADGTTSELTSVRDMYDAAGSLVSASEASVVPPPMVQDLMEADSVPPIAAMDAVVSALFPEVVSNSGSSQQQQAQVKRKCWCGKTFSKVSEFNKHYKRHFKRFLCPFPGCLQRFGTKDDWRRHDSRCHYQHGFYKCLFGGHVTCRAAFSKEQFDAHLDSIHWQRSPPVSPPEGPHSAPPLANIPQDELKLQRDILSGPERRRQFYQRCHNGQNNCEDNFWCGFCRKLIKIEDGDWGLKAMNMRVDHIATHFATDAPAGVQFDEGAATGGGIPALTGLPGGGAGGVALPPPAVNTEGTDAAGGVAATGPKWMHYDDFDMRENGPFREDDEDSATPTDNKSEGQSAAEVGADGER